MVGHAARVVHERVRSATRANRVAIGQLNTHLQETLGGVEVIRAFGREELFAAMQHLGILDAELSLA